MLVSAGNICQPSESLTMRGVMLNQRQNFRHSRLPTYWGMSIKIVSMIGDLGSVLASLTDLIRVQTLHNLFCGFGGDTTFITCWSGGRFPSLSPNLSLCSWSGHHSQRLFRILEGNESLKVWVQNQLQISCGLLKYRVFKSAAWAVAADWPTLKKKATLAVPPRGPPLYLESTKKFPSLLWILGGHDDFFF